MRIAFVGAGNVATCLSLAFRRAGHDVCGVYSRTRRSAEELAAVLGCPAVTELPDLPEAEAYVFAVKDDALPRLAAAWPGKGREALFLHTAGSVPLEVLAPCGDRRGVLYPLQTFSKGRAADLRETPCFVEGSSPATLEDIRTLAGSVAREVIPLDGGKRRRLHLAAVFACNFVNHCYALAADVLEKEGLERRWLLPLIDETARKVHDLPPLEAQTGPAVRMDRAVMARHESLLADEPEALAVYGLMSRGIHEAAGRRKRASGGERNKDTEP